VNFIFCTMMFSGGMPILYPIAAVFCIFYYWTDKYLIINFYQRPPVFSAKIALTMLSWEKLALLAHVGITSWMFAARLFGSTSSGDQSRLKV